MKRTAVIGLLLLGPVSTSAALTDNDDKLIPFRG
jgi:predicted ribosomally synthesized peptide with SipW-like signal peptide